MPRAIRSMKKKSMLLKMTMTSCSMKAMRTKRPTKVRKPRSKSA